MRRVNRFTPALLLSVVALIAPACGPGEEETRGVGSRAFPVEVEKAEGRSVEYVVTANGSVDAFEEVQVTARVSGVIEHIHFREGQTVGEDTVLIEIEPRRYQYELDMAKAAKARAEAELKEARDGLRRRENPAREGSTIFSKEEVEAWRTRVAVAEANLELREAELSEAELNLEYARPTPPMAGEVQDRQVRTGQWVTEGTVVASLIRRDPMLVRFSVPEHEASAIRTGQTAKFRVSTGSHEYNAVIVHVSASADRTTRMRRVTAEVEDEDVAVLTPGEFARVRVIVDQRSDAVTVPDTAVRPSERGYLVYVVKDGKGEARVVEIGMRTPDGRIEVKQGLEIGDVVVIRGADALRPGVDVTIVKETPPAAAGVSP